VSVKTKQEEVVFHFVVPGNPVLREETALACLPNGATKKERWQNWVRLHALEKGPVKVLTEPITMDISFYLRRPRKGRKKESAPGRSPVLDELSRSVTEALRGMVYAGDDLIVEKRVRKQYGDPPRVEITIALAPRMDQSGSAGAVPVRHLASRH